MYDSLTIFLSDSKDLWDLSKLFLHILLYGGLSNPNGYSPSFWVTFRDVVKRLNLQSFVRFQRIINPLHFRFITCETTIKVLDNFSVNGFVLYFYINVGLLRVSSLYFFNNETVPWEIVSGGNVYKPINEDQKIIYYRV